MTDQDHDKTGNQMTYHARIQLTQDVYKTAGRAFFDREVPAHEAVDSGENGVWLTTDVPGTTDLEAGEWLYNLLTRFEMDWSMRSGTVAKNDPMDDGIVLMTTGEGRIVLMSGVNL